VPELRLPKERRESHNLSLDDSWKLDDARNAFCKGYFETAEKLVRIFKISPVRFGN